MLAKLVQITSLKVGDRPDLLRSFIYNVKYTFLGWRCLVGGRVLVEGLGLLGFTLNPALVLRNRMRFYILILVNNWQPVEVAKACSHLHRA